MCIAGLLVHSFLRVERESCAKHPHQRVLYSHGIRQTSSINARNCWSSPYKTNKGFVEQAQALQTLLPSPLPTSQLEARYTAHHGDRNGRPTGGSHRRASL